MKEAKGIGFVGLGRVASALASGFDRAGLTISPSFDISAEKLRAWRELGFSAAETLKQAAGAGEVLFITTTDDAIDSVAEQLSNVAETRTLKAVFHTSGARPASILSRVAQQNIDYGCIHPVMSFSGDANDADRLRGCTFCVEAGTKAGARMAENLCEQLGGEVIMLSSEAKVAHHIACSIASNFAVLLMDEARSVHRRAGVTSEASLAMLGRLAQAAVQNTAKLGPEAALTGPFARGDAATVESHVRWLKQNMPELLDLYTTLGRRTVKLALRAHRITLGQADALLKRLSIGLDQQS
ncbi:MAG TPA: DUF2520 domain-containing protein [bacterium]|nr:DUF2520 domain-containing protein [bacterium]